MAAQLPISIGAVTIAATQPRMSPASTPRCWVGPTFVKSRHARAHRSDKVAALMNSPVVLIEIPHPEWLAGAGGDPAELGSGSDTRR